MENNLLKYFTSDELLKISEDNDILNKSMTLITKLFENKKDKAGRPYIGHLIRVSESLADPIERVSALLHDTVEDTDITFKDLIDVGIPLEIIEIVKLVTKPNIDTSNMTKEERLKLYNDEIDKIINSGNIHAIRLKKADMSDNYNKERLSELPLEKQEWFKEKYCKQLIKLNAVTEKENLL